MAPNLRPSINSKTDLGDFMNIMIGEIIIWIIVGGFSGSIVGAVRPR